MKKLLLHDQRCLDAAEGWLGLGDPLSANEELEKVSTESRAHPLVLEVRLQTYWAAKEWEACVEVAGMVVKLTPNILDGWIGRSFALHELNRTQEAYDLLLPAKDRFPKNWVVPYNLTCYCAKLNRLEEAQDWFKKALAIDEETVKREAVDDPDLKPLWDSMGGMMW